MRVRVVVVRGRGEGGEAVEEEWVGLRTLKFSRLSCFSREATETKSETRELRRRAQRVKAGREEGGEEEEEEEDLRWERWRDEQKVSQMKRG